MMSYIWEKGKVIAQKEYYYLKNFIVNPLELEMTFVSYDCLSSFMFYIYMHWKASDILCTLHIYTHNYTAIVRRI